LVVALATRKVDNHCSQGILHKEDRPVRTLGRQDIPAIVAEGFLAADTPAIVAEGFLAAGTLAIVVEGCLVAGTLAIVVEGDSLLLVAGMAEK
jgi:hypothetical protein